MSSSSLTALPSSDAPHSDRTLPAVENMRPVARRTYGRRRDASPVTDHDGPTLGALFTSSDPPQPLPSNRTYHSRESPSKALLNRFSTSATGWMSSLDALGADNDMAGGDAADDEDALKLEMAKLRQAARKEKSSASTSRSIDLPAPTAEVAPRKVTINRLHATSSSSTLTTLPTSPLRSSPPPRSSVSIIKAVPANDVPTHRPDLLNMFDESSDEDRPPSPVKQRSVSPTSERSTTPTPAMGDRRSATRSSPRSPSSPPHIVKPKTSRLQAFMADLDSENDRSDLGKGASPRSPAQDNVNDFLATLRQDDDGDEVDERAAEDEKLVKQTSSLSVALFDEDEDDEHPSGRKKGKKVKSLARKEIAQMHKDVAAAKRDRQYHPFKPDVDHLPISSWAQNAYNSILKASDIPPMLVQDNGSPTSSPLQVTPDEITAFTPSSAARSKIKPLDQKRLPLIPGTSSPTPIVLGQQDDQQAAGENDNDDNDDSLDAMLERDLAKLENRDNIEDRRKVLQRRKEAALRRSKWTGKPEGGHDSSDEELSVMPSKEPIVRFDDVKPAIAQRTAKSVLDAYKSSNGMTKKRQAVLPMTASKSSSRGISESLAVFAGKTFQHAHLRTANGGSRPAGQKINRDVPVSQQHMNAWMAEQHLKQTRSVREKKEEIFKVKQRRLPPKQVKSIEEQLEVLKAREAAGASWVSDDEDAENDEEDDDVQPSGSEAENEEDGEDAEVLQYSGGEEIDEEGQDEHDGEDEPTNFEGEQDEGENDERIEVDGEIDNNEKENERPLGTTPEKRLPDHDGTSPSRSVKAVERSTPRPARSPLTEIQSGPSVAAPNGFASTFVDVGGFGSGGGGSPGFSQLFEATQAAGPSGEADAFARLRDQHEVLLPTQALLPQVEITKTQLERDHAMIAGDGERDGGDDAMEQRPKTQYLNENGFFTQTKPLKAARTTSEASANLLAGSSVLLGEQGSEDHQPGYDLSSTQRGTSEGDIGEQEDESLRRSTTPTGGHSLAATEGDDEMGDDEGDEDNDMAVAAEVQPVDAFARLMSAGQLPLSKHQKRAKALIRSNLVDEQAEESEDDDWMMPGQKSDDEDDHDGEDNAYLADLVNDEAVNEEEKRKQDALVAAKVREVQMADDAKREAEARKITEGEYRHKRRGKDFYSDDEDGSPRKKRWSKKERRARKAWKEDGLEKLDGETNVFHAFYDNDLDSDVESVEEVPSPRKQATPSPKRTHEEKMEMLRRVARMNKEGPADHEEIDLDDDLGLGRSLSRDEGDDTETEVTEETQYSISRIKRSTVTEIAKRSSATQIESLSAYMKDAQTARRIGAASGASVVRQNVTEHSARSGFGGRPHLSKSSKAVGGFSSSAGSILLSKTSKFA